LLLGYRLLIHPTLIFVRAGVDTCIIGHWAIRYLRAGHSFLIHPTRGSQVGQVGSVISFLKILKARYIVDLFPHSLNLVVAYRLIEVKQIRKGGIVSSEPDQLQLVDTPNPLDSPIFSVVNFGRLNLYHWRG